MNPNTMAIEELIRNLLARVAALEAKVLPTKPAKPAQPADDDGMKARCHDWLKNKYPDTVPSGHTITRHCDFAHQEVASARAEAATVVQGLLDIIHDDLTHARQHDHAEAIRAAMEFVGKERE